ncbi:hypothetical protein GCM10023075_81320 [Streptosporangium album]
MIEAQAQVAINARSGTSQRPRRHHLWRGGAGGGGLSDGCAGAGSDSTGGGGCGVRPLVEEAKATPAAADVRSAANVRAARKSRGLPAMLMIAPGPLAQWNRR